MDNPSHAFLSFIQQERDLLEARIDAFKACFALCESPLEQHFLLTWIQIFGANAEYEMDDSPYVANEWEIEQGRLTFILYPQRSAFAEDKHYRLDFFLGVYLQTTGHFIECDVEIDGHDFHERTKEQARRDRARDRALTRRGYKVIRFTGQEVYSNVIAVIGEIQETVRLSIEKTAGVSV